ncbi:hypothetical protein PALU110988_26265 [Paenibacillus lupini]|nr:hypothetical protein [Paenibacillus lupini]
MLPSDPVYITIQRVPKSTVPVVSSNVSGETVNIQGTNDGPSVDERIPTIIYDSQ